MDLNKNTKSIIGIYNAIDITASPKPIIRNAENKYPINKSKKVMLFKSKRYIYIRILLSSQSFESDQKQAIFPPVNIKQ